MSRLRSNKKPLVINIERIIAVTGYPWTAYDNNKIYTYSIQLLITLFIQPSDYKDVLLDVSVTPGCQYKSHRVDIDTSEYSNSTINVQNKFNHLIEQIRTRAFVQVTQRIEID